jgi:hypothetical protein
MTNSIDNKNNNNKADKQKENNNTSSNNGYHYYYAGNFKFKKVEKKPLGTFERVNLAVWFVVFVLFVFPWMMNDERWSFFFSEVYRILKFVLTTIFS